ncbi:MAG: S8 family serine peptidase [Bacteroidales bacterium]|nr:S8 family serine peptidase [Bacteroidales bacterium]MDD4671652.1 S8 family serine peptidase [Bacteroidales bacterium]MDY0349271.1 S8 family serine peptidase [Tenuifilaceae bacterium]
MNYQFSRVTLISFIFLFLGCSFLQNRGIAQSSSSNVKYVNGYKVVKGERPPIDLATVPADAFEQGKIYVKFNPDVKHLISDNEIVASNKECIETGLQKFDKICLKYRITHAKQSISNLYKINGASKSHKSKHEAWGLNLWYELSLDAHADIKDVVSEFQQLSEVEFAEPVYKVRLIEPVFKEEAKQVKGKNSKTDETWAPNDPLYRDYQWQYNNRGQVIQNVTGTKGIDINLEKVWELEKGNPNVIVAVMDGGIDFNHPDLAANMWSQIGPEGEDTTPCSISHGTHVGGTVAAVSNNSIGVAGVAGGSGIGDGVRLMTLDIFDGSHGLNDLGLYVYSADNGAAISQNSWGYEYPDVYNQSALLGIDYFTANGGGEALLEGGIVIFAAGNDNDNGEWYPAYYSPTMAVASHDNRGIKSGFSNFGDWVDISAPGTYIISTGNVDNNGEPTYIWKSGTSMACPHVSGVAGLGVSYFYGQVTRTDLWNALVNGVDDIYTLNPSYQGELGTGRLNAYKAIMNMPEYSVDFIIVDENREPIQDAEIIVNSASYYTNVEGKVVVILKFGDMYSVNASGYISTEGKFFGDSSNQSIGLVLLSENTNYPQIKGENEVCSGSNVIYTIDTPDAGVYEVKNGAIITNPGGNSLIVSWLDKPNGKINFRITDEHGFITTVSKTITINNNIGLREADRPDIVKKGSIPILICTSPNHKYKWFMNGKEISDQTRQDYVPRGLTGSFRVQIIDKNQCPNISEGVLAAGTAASEVEISVYPNPADKVFNVSLTSESIGNGVIIISNLYGKVVLEESIFKNKPHWEKQYQLNELTQGVYIVKVSLNSSITVSTKVTVY